MSNEEIWTIQKLIQWTTTHFTSKGISSARLDGELLLAHVLKCKRLDLYLKFDQPLRAPELATFKQLVIRRSQREPLAYITGSQEFFSRSFLVGKGVLIPRPETELIIGEAAQFIEQKEETIQVLDIGCGSGIIGVTLACEHPNVQVTSVDISRAAIDYTKKNAAAHEVSEQLVTFHSPYLTWATSEKFDLVVSNPPYIARSEKENLMKDVAQFEPEEALYGGEKGYETLGAWLPRMSQHLKSGGMLLCEIGYDQKEQAHELASKIVEFTNIEVLPDYSGHPRILKAQKN